MSKPRKRKVLVLPQNAKIELLPAVVRTDARDFFEMIIKVMEQRDAQ